MDGSYPSLAVCLCVPVSGASGGTLTMKVGPELVNNLYSMLASNPNSNTQQQPSRTHSSPLPPLLNDNTQYNAPSAWGNGGHGHSSRGPSHHHQYQQHQQQGGRKAVTTTTSSSGSVVTGPPPGMTVQPTLTGTYRPMNVASATLSGTTNQSADGGDTHPANGYESQSLFCFPFSPPLHPGTSPSNNDSITDPASPGVYVHQTPSTTNKGHTQQHQHQHQQQQQQQQQANGTMWSFGAHPNALPHHDPHHPQWQQQHQQQDERDGSESGAGAKWHLPPHLSPPSPSSSMSGVQAAADNSRSIGGAVTGGQRDHGHDHRASQQN